MPAMTWSALLWGSVRGGLPTDVSTLGMLLGTDQVLVQPVGPTDGGVRLDVTDASDTRLDGLDIVDNELSGHLDLDPEHQLLSLAARLDLLGCELRFRGHEGHISDPDAIGLDVDREPRLGAELD